MKVHDESEYQQQCAEWAASPNSAALAFQAYLETWAGHAEKVEGVSAIEALRSTLRLAEKETERWSIGFVGQALLLLVTHWEPLGDRELFFDSMTPIEQNLLLDTAAQWYVTNLQTAEEVGGGTGEPA